MIASTGASVAEKMPESMHVAASLLGQANLRQVERHYNLAPPAGAIRRYHEVLFAARAPAVLAKGPLPTSDGLIQCVP